MVRLLHGGGGKESLLRVCAYFMNIEFINSKPEPRLGTKLDISRSIFAPRASFYRGYTFHVLEHLLLLRWNIKLENVSLNVSLKFISPVFDKNKFFFLFFNSK